MAEDPLVKATRQYKRAQAAMNARRAGLIYEVGVAIERGRKQAEIVEITGFTREHIRRMWHDYQDLNSRPDPFGPSAESH
jgi:hypothetical protein